MIFISLGHMLMRKLYYVVTEHLVPKVDVSETGRMNNVFDQIQIVTTW